MLLKPVCPSMRRVHCTKCDLTSSQVIAFTCCIITVILMTAATSTADWILAEGWREGLFMQCISEGAPTPLPFDMPPEPGCGKVRSAGEVSGSPGHVSS